MEENCTTCCYSEFTSLIEINNLIGKEFCRCLHQNSPYYEEVVSDNTTCRLYLDYNQYIKLKDRKEAILNIKNKYK